MPPSADQAARYTGLHAAAHRGDVAAIRKLVSERKHVDSRDAHGRTPLHVATFARKREAIRALVAAAHLGHDGVVRQLIAAGAPLDHVNNLHWTAVIEAIVLGDGGKRHQETLRALIAAGANLQLADRQGRTPLSLARGRGYIDMARMLENAGAR